MSKLKPNKDILDLVNNFTYGEDLGFGKTMAPVMIEMKYKDGKWSSPEYLPYGPLSIDPAAKVLHYAQEIFEGMKAYKNDKGEVYIFRPEANAKRFNLSAIRMAMPEVPEEDFLDTVKSFSSLMAKHVPVGVNKSLYLRPFMIATEPTLGVKASSEYSYYLIGCLVERYFSRPSVKVMVELDNCRAAPGGIGYAKTGGNYGASLAAYKKTQDHKCDQTLWLDALNKKYVEELSGMNFFAVIGNDLVTPELTDTILAGITRDAILKVAQRFNLTPVEKKLEITTLLDSISSGECKEAFACGTASVLTPIESLEYKDKTYKLSIPDGDKSKQIKDYILGIQRGLEKDPHNWAVKVN
ncbi:MAG: branched chain amino acid aminotransferase [Halobacteriovoraceae bacterium]|nr:branched chain amino acid aminotransferase [Halobacteriovoraceae bacterium]|tara:strand:+ start:19163 stop:20224 length:1062 start_codon:yes stop_codon:yes gene_type:complete